MPRAAQAGAYPAARLIFFVVAMCDRRAFTESNRIQMCVGGMIGLMEISASMETTRIHDSLVSLGGGWNGVAGTRGRGKVWLGRGVLCAAGNSGSSRGATRSSYYPDAAENFKGMGLIFARRAMTACWVAHN